MKKMQCEVCGSNEIKKISDDLFECQSCGVQYTKNEIQKMMVEISGEVKIDHTADIENALQRADSFMEEGNTDKALEYCNKVLDLEPENEQALQGVQAVRDREAATETETEENERIRASAVSVIKHTVSADEGKDIFLRELAKIRDIAPDVYREIEIISATEGYYPFSSVDEQYIAQYDGMACYRERVPYTDYETKTDYDHKDQYGHYLEKQVAVTKYREEIDRQPVNGTFCVDQCGVFTVSGQLGRKFTKLNPEDYDEAFGGNAGKGSDQTHCRNDILLKKTEDYVRNRYQNWKDGLTEIYTAKQPEIDGIPIIIDDIDPAWGRRRASLIKQAVYDKISRETEEKMPGDFYENLHCSWQANYSREDIIYVPIQIIEYAYRGQFYLAVLILTADNYMLLSYPCDTEQEKERAKSDEQIEAVKGKGLTWWIKLLYWLAGISAVFSGIFVSMFVYDGFSEIWWTLLIPPLAPLIPAIVGNVRWKKKKTILLRQILQRNTDTLSEKSSLILDELNREYQAFIEAYTETRSVAEGNAAAKNVSTFSPDPALISGRIHTASYKRAEENR